LEALEIFLLVLEGLICLAILICLIIINKNFTVSRRKLGWSPFAIYNPKFYTEKGNRFRNYYLILVMIGMVVGCIYMGVVLINSFD